MEEGARWLSLNEDRVHELLNTLGVCGWEKLQESILEHGGVTVAPQPLRTCLDGAYAQGGKLHTTAIHDKALKAVRDSAYDHEVAMAKPIYETLLKLFLETPGALSLIHI